MLYPQMIFGLTVMFLAPWVKAFLTGNDQTSSAVSRILYSKYSNLNIVRATYIKQLEQLDHIDSSDETKADEVRLSEICIETMQEKQDKKDVLGPFFKYIMQGVNYSLECSSCVPKGYLVSWKKLSYDGKITEVETPKGSDPLKLQLGAENPELVTYYCYWINDRNFEEVIDNIYSLEIFSVNILVKSTPRVWEGHPEIQDARTGLIAFTKWGEWSSCSKCNTVGKRHRIGYCAVESILNREKDVTKGNFEAFLVYSDISCSMFLNLHPTIVEINEEFSLSLGTPPVLLVGYCKVPCEYFDFPPEDVFIKTYPKKIRDLYKAAPKRAEDVEILSQNISLGKETLTLGLGTQNGGFDIMHYIRSLKNIPFTTKQIPEMLALLGLLAIQMFIVIQVCKYKEIAK